MKSNYWLNNSSLTLKSAGISTSRLDCLILLEDELGENRSWILANPEHSLQGQSLNKLNLQIERRAKHEPLAYIRGKSEFYGREFAVNNHTLQPRPESEPIITLLKKLIPKSHFSHLLRDGPLTGRENVKWVVVDVGTGSGCLGISAKLEIPSLDVVSIDVSKNCLKIAQQNATKLKADIKLMRGDLLTPFMALNNQQPTIILANLPYVPDKHTINEAAMHEPSIAIFGGEDGLDLYRKMFDQIKKLESKPIYILTESLPFQHKLLVGIAKNSGYELNDTDDFIQVFTLNL